MSLSVPTRTSEPSVHAPARDVNAERALKQAWGWWVAMLVFPFIIAMAVMYSLMDAEGPARDSTAAHVWFAVSMAYLAVFVPLSFFWRSHIFRAYWHGHTVEPRAYLKGMVSVWATIEVGGILALIGCLASHSLLPCLLPALVAFMLFTPLWPSGSAMVRHDGDKDDPARYEEPR